MGQARARGSEEQRIAMAIERDKRLLEEEKKRRAEREANMTPEEKRKRAESRKALGTIMSMANYFAGETFIYQNPFRYMK